MKQRNRRDKNRVTSNVKQNGHIGSPKHVDSNLDSSLSELKTRNKKLDIFPPITPWIVCAITMAIRVHYVIQPKNWWILHPDEIYQTLEVAHCEVYGYGFRTHEYLAAPRDDNTTQMRMMEVKMGMHSMRSFLLPRFFILISWLAGIFGFTEHPFMLWKASHAVVTSLLPFAVYKFTRTLFRSHDTGVIAAILTAGSTHLTVFGTHTFINSFIGTPVFFALSTLFENIVGDTSVKKTREAVAVCKEKTNSVLLESPIHASSQCETDVNAKLNGSLQYDSNHNIVQHNSEGTNISNGYLTNNKCKCSQVNGNVANTVQYDNERDSHMNILSQSDLSPNKEISMRNVGVSTFILTLCCYIRLDVAMIVVVMSLPFFNSKWLQRKTIISVMVGALMALLIGLFDDFKSYGFGVISPYHWFQFNVVRDFSARIYGSMEWSWYIRPLLFENPAIAILLLVSVISILTSYYFKSFHSDSDRRRTAAKLCASVLILLVFYSMKSHKELRFLYSSLVLLFIIFAYSINTSANITLITKYNHASQIFLLFTLIPFLISQWYIFPSATNKSVRSWTYVGNTQSHDVNMCLDYVSRQDDVTGVYTDSMVHMTGGYTLLHKNVPILGLIHYEFYEFSHNARANIKSSNYMYTQRNITVSTFTQISDFISFYRTSYLIKLLITSQKYNYLIIGADSHFKNLAYDAVFKSGTKSVLKRNPDANHHQIEAYAAKIPLGTNATLLTYEGDWLIKFNQHKLARQRLLKAIDLDPSFVEAYKRLALSYTLLGELRASGKVMGTCIAAVNKKSCYENPKRIVLHEAYNFQL